MRRFIFLLAILVPCTIYAQKARIQFATTSHNFGTIDENAGKAVFHFNFRNTGKVPLILTNVRAGCGCTTPEWSKQPVAPGGTGTIKVAFDPRNRPGAFVKSIAVNSNASNSVVSLTVRGKVNPQPAGLYDAYTYSIGSIKLPKQTVNLGAMTNHQVVERKIEVINSEDRPVTIQVSGVAPYLTVNVEPATLAKDQKGTISINYDASKKEDWGFLTDKIEVKVNDETKGVLVVAATISEDFSHYNGHFEKAPVISLSSTEFTMNDLEKNSSAEHEFYIQNTGKSELIIRKIKTSDDNISVSIPKQIVKPGKKIKVGVRIKTGNASRFIKVIQFTTNDPQNPVVTYKITGHLK